MKQAVSSLQKYLSRSVGFLLMITGLNVYAGNLTASVDRDTLSLEETFTLVLRYDEQISATPDYELLRKDFDILNTQSGTQMSIINGNMEASTEWKIALAPKRIGKLLIPSFTIDGAISDAIEMTIEGKSRAPQNTDSNVSVEVETSKDSSYVQEQIIVTLRLYTTVGLNGVELQPLQVKDALVVNIDEKQYQTKINSRPGAVVETRYAVFPQHSGELIIPSMLYQVSVSSGQRDMWDRFYGNNQNNILRLRTEEQRINVLPAPTSVNAAEWQPANNLSLSEHWSTSIDSLKVGEPVTRSITIKADGLTAGQINPLQLAPIDGLTFYNDQAQTDDQKSANGVEGSRIETIAIVPTKAGNFTLPEVKVNWWDTKSNSIRTATLPAVTLNVGLGSMSQLSPPIDETIDQTTNEPTSVALNTDLSSIQPQQPVVQEKAPVWLYLTNLLTLLAALFFALRLWLYKRSMAAANTKADTEAQASNQTENEAWSQLKRSLSDKNLTVLRKAIIDWSQAHWKNASITSLQAVAEQANEPTLTAELQKLDEAIFSSHKGTPDTEALLQLLANLRKNKQKKMSNNEQLSPLYKT
ncbi:BatD family protein [Cellvibrio sp. NN19]|uniref:BatD family protein n=1 Tax=Cellvibrio chitinivorans TaxID=3102792 RepID=UPI002B4121B5|nr:BatD family protein [Cellvibrio sp. NN19]